MAQEPRNRAEPGECPPEVADFADQAVTYVRAAIGVTLEFNSETLPVLDHYLKTAGDARPSATALIAATAGAYFGEVVRRRLGGQWDTSDPDPGEWRFELPGGMWFRPAGMVMAAIFSSDEHDEPLTAPPRMRDAAEQALARMGEVTADDYYSLCGRFDTIEHLQAVLLAMAAREAARRGLN
jgi:hypothetical protein